jgi:hypothetical protein
MDKAEIVTTTGTAGDPGRTIEIVEKAVELVELVKAAKDGVSEAERFSILITLGIVRYEIEAVERELRG